MTVDQHIAVAAKVEAFREQLGFKPFATFAKEQRELHKLTLPPDRVRVPRQTGRTTYALLKGIATAIETGEPLVVMGASAMQTDHLCAYAQRLVASLGVQVAIKKMPRSVVVRDHQADETCDLACCADEPG